MSDRSPSRPALPRFVALVALALSTPNAMADTPPLLIDDFSRSDGRSALGTAWQGFTDRVMGGRSDMRAGVVELDDGRALAMSGQVRLDNNGGFIQVRLPLAASGRFDASGYGAILLRVRGEPGPYYLHLRSADTRLPWQYYRAPIAVSSDWQDLRIEFSAFTPEALRSPLDRSRLQSLAVVAYGEVFEAAIEVARVELLP